MMKEAALGLARAGWDIFPCIPKGENAKAPLVEHGFKSGTHDIAVVEKWWDRWPEAMIGLKLPPEVMVIDVDPRHDGSLEDVEKKLGHLPPTRTTTSGRGDGGQHFYYLHPGGRLYGKQLPEGVDLKEGGKGYVICPPSIHPETGKPYTWNQEPIVALPTKAARILQTPPVSLQKNRFYQQSPNYRDQENNTMRQKSVEGILRTLAAAKPGERNNLLFWAACRFQERAATVEEWVRLEKTATQIGLGYPEIGNTIRSAQQPIGGKRPLTYKELNPRPEVKTRYDYT